MPGWLFLFEPVTATPTITNTEQVRVCATTNPAPKPTVFSRPAGITAIVAAKASGLRPARSP